MVTQVELGSAKVVLTAPLSLEGDDESGCKDRPPNVIKRILSFLGNLRAGSDLSRLQLPPLFNFPKSQLQCYGEALYCINSDMLSKCNRGENSYKRFLCVVAWSISTLRPLSFGLAPYNPILGETHHVSRGTLNVLLEQVSHHPPITALHATDEEEKIDMLWCHSPVPKFYGSHIETEVQGKRQLKLLDKNETYVMNSPKLVIRFLPFPGVDWLGNVRIQCQETGLEAELCYRGNSFLPRPSVHRSVIGKIFHTSTAKPIYTIDGHWDRTVVAKDVTTGKTSVIYNGKEALSGLKTPFIKEPNSISASESTVVWAEVSEAILHQNWEKAREAKTCIEDRQREVARERKSNQEDWVPKHFTVPNKNESGWDCLPYHNSVPPAPIVVSL